MSGTVAGGREAAPQLDPEHVATSAPARETAASRSWTEPAFHRDTSVVVTSTSDDAVCPECGRPAAVERRQTITTEGCEVEHVTIVCSYRHLFLMPTSMLSADWR